MQETSPGAGKVTIRLATELDREAIYRVRHAVYAEELGQHATNADGRLTDSLDAYNHYVVALLGKELAGFVSITPPDQERYSIDKYFARDDLPLPFDAGLYEVRLLTVLPRYRGGDRGGEIAGLLIYAAFRWIEDQGGCQIVAIGRREVVGLYLRVGLKKMGRQVQSGAVTYDLLSATLADLQESRKRYAVTLRQVEPDVDWQVGIPFHALGCFHGGAFFDAIGDEFGHLDRAGNVINAYVLDAWFPPSPRVLAALHEHLPWLLRSSPPTHAEGLARVIARVRGVGPEHILAGAGSSPLIFLALRHWLSPSSRVLLLDPMYGEYAHALLQLVHCPVDRLPLFRESGYVLEPSRLEAALATGYDLVILVNPCNPTGTHVDGPVLAEVLRRAPRKTRFWVDEAYIEYAGPGQSLERLAALSQNIVVCKTLSKVYALSGARVGYLCGAADVIEELRPFVPPYAVSLPAQVAAIFALQEPAYYAARYAETHILREELVAGLRSVGIREVVPGIANFVLCHLPDDFPDATSVTLRCRAHGLYLRNVSNMGARMGSRAIRVAVKDRATNQRLVEILDRVLRGLVLPGSPNLGGLHPPGQN